MGNRQSPQLKLGDLNQDALKLQGLPPCFKHFFSSISHYGFYAPGDSRYYSLRVMNFKTSRH